MPLILPFIIAPEYELLDAAEAALMDEAFGDDNDGDGDGLLEGIVGTFKA